MLLDYDLFASASEATATWCFTNFVLYCIVLYVIPTKWRSYRGHIFCDVSSPYVLLLRVSQFGGKVSKVMSKFHYTGLTSLCPETRVSDEVRSVRSESVEITTRRSWPGFVSGRVGSCRF